jgi:uncharacterized protein (DUF983 family)
MVKTKRENVRAGRLAWLESTSMAKSPAPPLFSLGQCARKGAMHTKLNRGCDRKTRGGIAMKNQLRWDFPRVLVVVLVIVGIVTAALNATLGGFTPIMWFLLALVVLLIITCHEIMRIRISLESKNP